MNPHTTEKYKLEKKYKYNVCMYKTTWIEISMGCFKGPLVGLPEMLVGIL